MLLFRDCLDSGEICTSEIGAGVDFNPFVCSPTVIVHYLLPYVVLLLLLLLLTTAAAAYYIHLCSGFFQSWPKLVFYFFFSSFVCQAYLANGCWPPAFLVTQQI